jgi:hypothetical protein
MSATTIRMIHVACRDLGLDQDTRHELQQRITGKTSLSDMCERELKLVVDELKAKGWTPAPKKGGKTFRNFASRGDIRFCHVLWGKLVRAGAVQVPGATGLNAFVRARFETAWGAVPIDVDQMRDHRQIAAVIEALKGMCKRAGVAL